MSRAGEMHISRAKIMISKAKAEALRLRREANSNKNDGIKKMSRAIEDEPANPLLCVKGIETQHMVGRKEK